MNIGEFDRKIQIQRATTSVGSEGEVTQVWTTYFSPWAKAIPLRTLAEQEDVRAQKTYSQTIYEFNFRYSSEAAGISAEDRLVFDGGVYDINEIQIFPRGRPEWIRVVTDISTDLPEDEQLGFEYDLQMQLTS